MRFGLDVLHRGAQFALQIAQMLDVGGDADGLHVGQHRRQRQLQFRQQPGRAALNQVGVERVGQVGHGHGAQGLGVGRRRVGLVLPAVERELPRRCGGGDLGGPQLAVQVAQGQIGQVERPLPGQGQVRRELGVAGDPGQRQPARPQGQQRALDVMRSLGHGFVGQPIGQGPFVVGGQVQQVDVAGLAVRRSQGHALEITGTAAPGAAKAQPDPGRAAGVRVQPQPDLLGPDAHRVHVEALLRLGLGRGERLEQPLAQHPELKVVEQLMHLVAVP